MKISIFSLIVLWNLLVFALYGLDKKRARKQAYRISERTLLLSSLAGAGLAAYLAGQIFHHKTRKGYFWLSWMVGSLVEVGIFYLLWRV